MRVAGIIVLVSVSWLAAGPVRSQEPAKKTEVRAIWVHLSCFASHGAEKGPEEVRRWVDRVADANFNLLLVWVKSDYVAGLEDGKYAERAPHVRWDAMAEMSKAAAARDLAVHIWYSFCDYKSTGSPEFDPKHGGSPGWMARTTENYQEEKIAGTGAANCCPMHPEARKWQFRLVAKLLDRYPAVTGIHIEEPGYRKFESCLCRLCRETFERIHARPLAERILKPEGIDFKCIGTTEIMRGLRNMLLTRDPKLQLTTNGGFDWKGDRRRARDWLNWARRGWIEFYAAQVYTSHAGAFRDRVEKAVGDFRGISPLVIGIAYRWSSGKNTTETVLEEIRIARELGAAGVSLFHGVTLPDDMLKALKEGLFREPAALPEPKR